MHQHYASQLGARQHYASQRGTHQHYASQLGHSTLTHFNKTHTTQRNAPNTTVWRGEAEVSPSLSTQRNATQRNTTQRNATHSTHGYGVAKPMSVSFSFCDSVAGFSADMCVCASFACSCVVAFLFGDLFLKPICASRSYVRPGFADPPTIHKYIYICIYTCSLQTNPLRRPFVPTSFSCLKSQTSMRHVRLIRQR